MYEHLTQILRNIFDYHPKEPRRLIEELSKKQELSIDSYLFAQKQFTILSVFQNHPIIKGNCEEIMKNIFELNNLFEQIGIGLNKNEIYWYEIEFNFKILSKFLIEKDMAFNESFT